MVIDNGKYFNSNKSLCLLDWRCLLGKASLKDVGVYLHQSVWMIYIYIYGFNTAWLKNIAQSIK